MPKQKLTNKLTLKSKCPTDKSKEVFYDTELTGFILEVRKTGRKSFYYSYSKNSKRTMHKIGDANIISADEARVIALKIRKAIAADKLENLFVTKHNTITLNKFYSQHYLPYIKVHSNSWHKNETAFRLHILPAIGEYPMDKLTPPIISKAHHELVTIKKLSNGTANKFVSFLRHAYNVAIDMRIDKVLDNPASRVKRFDEQNRDRYLTTQEAKRLLTSVEQSENIHLKYIIRFLILTGARTGEVFRAKWEDINYERGIWVIPITKNKKIRKIPISKQLYSLLQEIPKTSTYIFPSSKDNNKPYRDINRSWHNARKRAGLEDLRLHDLRHSFASQLVNSGRSLYEVQILLGHSDQKMTQRYAHLNNESLYAAVSCAGGLLE